MSPIPLSSQLLSKQETHVMLLAGVKTGRANEMKAGLQSLNHEKATASFKKQGITNLSSFTKELQGKSYIMVYFDFEDEDYLEAARAFESVEQTDLLNPLLDPHPRAEQDESRWLQLEWINYIYGAKPIGAKPEKIAQATRIKPDREDYYRTLHQTVWPGVAAHMVRAGNHDFSIFFVELGKELYQFFYVESYATEAQKEKMNTYQDPTYDRWYYAAAPCLDPLPGAVNCWTRMEQISE